MPRAHQPASALVVIVTWGRSADFAELMQRGYDSAETLEGLLGFGVRFGLRVAARHGLVGRAIRFDDLPPIQSAPAMESDAEDASDLSELFFLRLGWCVWIARHDGSLAR
jgi:hypothetical protein